jgi:hypothetical protein
MVAGFYKWKSPATMPPWASRLFLAVTAVRVARCRDVSEADAAAMGIRQDCSGFWWPYPTYEARDHLLATQLLWIDRCGPESWDRDEWVAVGTVEVSGKVVANA